MENGHHKTELLFSETLKVISWLVTCHLKSRRDILTFCELNKTMYTYNNMLYKHNKTHFSDFDKVFCFWFVLAVFRRAPTNDVIHSMSLCCNNGETKKMSN